jgi:ADP-heptose:LPS heptosyltransferase
MDSGILWLAHVASCPVLTLLGPTREEERVSLHPLYPEKAKSINIANMIGCTPCFETKARCGGKVNCMNNFDRAKLLEEIKLKISEIVGE